MTSVAELKAVGFKIEDADVGEGLTRVWHQDPFRYYNWQFHTLLQGTTQAKKAEPDKSGNGFSFLTTNVWKQTMSGRFPFAFIMEADMQALDEMALSIENVQTSIESLQASLRQLQGQQAALVARVTMS